VEQHAPHLRRCDLLPGAVLGKDRLSLRGHSLIVLGVPAPNHF
jgi:hypothetical protein